MPAHAMRGAQRAVLLLLAVGQAAAFVIRVSDRAACPADVVIVQWDREGEAILPGRDRMGLYPLRDLPEPPSGDEDPDDTPAALPEPEPDPPAETEPPDAHAAAADAQPIDTTLFEPVVEFAIGAEYTALPGATFWTSVGPSEGRFEFRAVRAPEAPGGAPLVLARSGAVSVRRAHCLRLVTDARDLCTSEALGVRWSVPPGEASDSDLIRIVDVTPGRDAREVSAFHAAALPEDAAGPVRTRTIARGPSEPGLYEARYYRAPLAGGPDAAWVMRSRPFRVRLKAGCGRPAFSSYLPSQPGLLDVFQAANRVPGPSGALAHPSGPFPVSQDLSGPSPIAMQPEYGITWPHAELLPLPVAAFSVSLWMYPSGDSPGDYVSVFFKGTGGCCRTPSAWLLSGSRQLLAQLSLDDTNYISLYSTARLPLHAWSHLVLVLEPGRGGQALQLYVNGRPDARVPVPPGRSVAMNDGPLYIGKNWNREGFRGMLGSMRTYLRALGPREAADLHAAERGMYPSPFAEVCGSGTPAEYLESSGRSQQPALGPQEAGAGALEVPGGDLRDPAAACDAGLDYLWDREGDLGLLAPAAARLLERCACGGAGAGAGGHPAAGRALWSLGLLHAAGLGLPRSVSKAVALYRLAAAHGESSAQMALGYRHSTGFQAPYDAEAAAYYYHVAAQKAQGHRHGGGGGVAIDGNWLKDVSRGKLAEGQKGEDDGLIQYEKYKADSGDVGAMMNLARWYYYGERGLPQDLAASYQYYAAAAETGHVGATTMLGNMEVRGEGCAVDYASAFDRFTKAAGQGDTEAMNGLAYMHMHGLHVPQDHKKALAEFDRAAVRGNANAVFNAASMYRGGVGTVDGKPNPDTAYYYFDAVARAGYALWASGPV
eukprot:tig00020801_g13973.t1